MRYRTLIIVLYLLRWSFFLDLLLTFKQYRHAWCRTPALQLELCHRAVCPCMALWLGLVTSFVVFGNRIQGLLFFLCFHERRQRWSRRSSRVSHHRFRRRVWLEAVSFVRLVHIHSEKSLRTGGGKKRTLKTVTHWRHLLGQHLQATYILLLSLKYLLNVKSPSASGRVCWVSTSSASAFFASGKSEMRHNKP